jgi:hypothetical protein
MIGKDSSTTVKDIFWTADNRVSGWKKHLKPVQVDRILRVVNEFDPDVYNHDGELDYSRIGFGRA